MILLPVFLVLLTTAVACLGLSHIVPTRTLGFAAAGAALLSALLALASSTSPLREMVAVAPRIWATIDTTTVYLVVEPHRTMTALIVTLLGSSAVALFALALALAPTVHDFGALFAWALLAIASACLGLASQSLLVAVAWTAAAVCAYSAVRSSGALAQTESPPAGLVLGLLAGLLLTGGMVRAELALAQGAAPGVGSGVAVALACLLLVGGAPFHHAFDELVEAPAALGGLLYGLVFPVLGLGTLLRLTSSAHPLLAHGDLALPAAWHPPLLAAGLLTMVACAANMPGERSLRRMVAWNTSAQAGGVLVAASLSSSFATLAAPALLINTVLTTLAGTMAVAKLEHLTGSDDYAHDLTTMPGARPALRMSGLLWALGIMSALGLPPLWGFWGKAWLLRAALEQAPWLLPLLLFASTLAAVAAIGPLARFWWPGDPQRHIRPDSVPPQRMVSSRVWYTVPLLAAGLVPDIVWQGWLAQLPAAPAAFPAGSDVLMGLRALALVGVLVAVALWRLPWVRLAGGDEDMVPVILAPSALATSLAPLAWFGRPASLVRGLGELLQHTVAAVRAALVPFEERYYLAGVVLALLSLILILARS